MKRIFNRRRLAPLLVPLSLAAGGCQLARDSRPSALSADAPAAACPRDASTPDEGRSWHVAEGPVTFRVPLGFEQLDVAPAGDDAPRVALFDSANGSVTLVSELGARAAEGGADERAGVAPLLRCTEWVGGRRATVIVFRVDSAGRPAQRLRHGRYVAEATWRDPVGPGQYLTLRGEGADPAALRVLFASLRSVRVEGEVARK